MQTDYEAYFSSIEEEVTHLQEIIYPCNAVNREIYPAGNPRVEWFANTSWGSFRQHVRIRLPEACDVREIVQAIAPLYLKPSLTLLGSIKRCIGLMLAKPFHALFGKKIICVFRQESGNYLGMVMTNSQRSWIEINSTNSETMIEAIRTIHNLIRTANIQTT